MGEDFRPEIGKNVIETLTMGMYDDPRYIYREYIQNSADSIDAGVKTKLLRVADDGVIEITIDPSKRKIVFEDNSTGVEMKKARSLLGNIAQSTKDRYKDKGFRGIGRLGGLGYCKKLTFETTFTGERLKSIMIWDASKLKEIIENPKIRIEASELVSTITDFSTEREESDKHYFKVVMDGVGNDQLLDISGITSFLSMVAPVPFSNGFSFSKEISKEAKKEKVRIDEYRILINSDQLYKAYKDTITNNNNAFDTVYDIEFFKGSFEKELLYWGWYGITKNLKQIPSENIEKFIRLRKGNIQIGRDTTLDEYHKTDTGNRYYIGEIYAVNRELVPNGRRDFFDENTVTTAFKERLGSFFKSRLYELYYDFSEKNSAFKIIKRELEIRRKLDKIEKRNLLNSTKKITLTAQLKQIVDQVPFKKAILVGLYEKYTGRALSKIIEEAYPIKDLKREVKASNVTSGGLEPSRGSKISARLSEIEKNLLDFVYRVIRSSESSAISSRVVSRIKEEIKQSYKKNS